MSSHKELEPIASFCESQGLPWGEECAERMARYLDLLMQFNESMNLIGPLDRETVVRELLLDSVVAAGARSPRGPILDVGTGAGLPGIPLKILCPDCPISLVEPRRKRSTFLKIATHRLGLEEVSIERCRIENFDGDGYDFAISKAFEAPTSWLATAAPRILSTGVVLCMARRADEQALVEEAADLGLELVGSATSSNSRVRSGEQRVCYAFGKADSEQK